MAGRLIQSQTLGLSSETLTLTCVWALCGLLFRLHCQQDIKSRSGTSKPSRALLFVFIPYQVAGTVESGTSSRSLCPCLPDMVFMYGFPTQSSFLGDLLLFLDFHSWLLGWSPACADWEEGQSGMHVTRSEMLALYSVSSHTFHKILTNQKP